MLDPIDPKPNFPQLEEEILKFWRENEIFEKSIEIREGQPPFIFYEGPPTANGKPGLHHVLARVFKDLFPRYQTMQGKKVLRKAGWDTHGLPVEIQVEKKLGISGKKEIESLKPTVEESIIYFNQECKELVWQDIQLWQDLTERIAYWVDFDQAYITYETEYIEELWQLIKQIWEQKLLYKGYKILHYCPRCGTSLSSHEVAQGYKDVTEDSVYVLFKKTDEPETYFMAWTTTPWTLPGNVGLAVSLEINYSIVKQEGKRLILAESRLNVLKGGYQIEKTVRGKELVGSLYQPLYDVVPAEVPGKRHQVLAADFVTTDDGTGIVHTAVMYGEDDYILGEKENLPKFHTVDPSGHFIPEVEKFAGQFVKDAEKAIITDLESRQLLYKIEPFSHSYPFCWRCDTPLLYYARDSWFIAMSKLRQELITANQDINWIPSHFKDGRFGEFIREAKDWAFSRERYWGTPLPIWRCEKCHQEECLSSLEAMKEKGADLAVLGEPINPHRPFIDKISWPCDCGGVMKREIYVIDVWFDSGAMPFASGEFKAGRYPADYICEAVDQTRGWFYTLLAISVLMKQKSPYRNVISLGHILDENGQKMSKSKGNIIDPWQVANEFGIDALRMHLFSLNQPGDTKQMSLNDLQSTLRKSVLLLWNIYSFFMTYAETDNYKNEALEKVESENLMDRWLVASFNQFLTDLTKHLDNYDPFNASRLHLEFLNDVSTWYLRRSRERREISFYQTIHWWFINYLKTLAPFAPFISDKIYQNLKSNQMPLSVHLTDWPKPQEIDKNILEQMNKVKELTEKIHALRASNGIKLRQPLNSLSLGPKDQLKKEYAEILRQEVNVLKIENSNEKTKLDTDLTDELLRQGDAKEFLRLVQNERKNKNLKPGEPATLFITTAQEKNFEKIKELIISELTAKASIANIVPIYNIRQGKILMTFDKKTINFTVERSK